MTVLVTGGAGFIGSHLCEQLLDRGEKVICIDNFYTGSKENIAHLLNNPKFILIEHDICEPYEPLCQIDQIYNLACPASPKHYQRDPIFTTRTCTLGVLNILELARKTGARVLQASTSEIYGDPAIHPQTESYFGNVNTIGPRACYDEGKRCAETLFFDYKRFHNVNICVARIFNTYGPRMQADDGRVVSNFLIQALRNEPLSIYGSGKQTRSFCYVDDLVEGLIALMNSPHIGPFNLGNPEEYTIDELAHRIGKTTESRSAIEYHSLPEDDPQRRCPNISQAQKHLNWQPKISLKEGLKKTLQYFAQSQAKI